MTRAPAVRVLPLLCFLAVSMLMSFSPVRAEPTRPIFGLLIGSNAYNPANTDTSGGTGRPSSPDAGADGGAESLSAPANRPSDLQFADDDMLRYLWLLKTLPGFREAIVLTHPDASTHQLLLAQGVTTLLEPTAEQLNHAFEQLQQKLDAVRSQRPQLLVMISAHGEAAGFHLEGSLYSGKELRARLDALSPARKDLPPLDVLLIGDTCFSHAWLTARGIGMRGDGSGPVAPNALPGPQEPVVGQSSGASDTSKTSKPAARLGAITTTSITPEDRSSLGGGVMTHVVTSGLMGDADFNNDDTITFEELQGYLSQYLGLHGPGSEVQQISVQAPAGLSLSAEAVRRPRADPRVRLIFPARVESAWSFLLGEQECFWLRLPAPARQTQTDKPQTGRWVAELCKPLTEEGYLFVPPGRYEVYRFYPPRAAQGLKGAADATPGPAVTVDDSALNRRWAKVVDNKTPPISGQEGVEPLSLADQQYLERSAYREEVALQRRPGFISWAIKLETLLPQLNAFSADSITQEQPSEWLVGALDVQVLPYGRAALIVGAESGAGISPGNQVAGVDNVTVVQTRLSGRMGLRMEVGRGKVQSLAKLGFLSGYPQDPAGLAPGESKPSSQTVSFVPLVALELGLQLPRRGPHHLELNLSVQTAREPYRAVNDEIYANSFTSIGIGLGYRR